MRRCSQGDCEIFFMDLGRKCERLLGWVRIEDESTHGMHSQGYELLPCL